jgi:hypothetical protein
MEVPAVILTTLLLGRVLGLILLINEFLHGLLVLLFEVLADLLDDVKKSRVLALILTLLLVHVLDELDQRVLDFPTGIREDHHDEVTDQRLTTVEILRSIVVDNGWVVELAEPAKIHGHLIVESHEF